jgi:hypothetical protein
MRTNWTIKTTRKDKRQANKIKKRIKDVAKIKEKIGCNTETARKSIDYDSEEKRKRMAQNFYYGK